MSEQGGTTDPMLRPDYQGVPFYSAPVTYAAGGLRFDMSFLEPAARMAAPVIRSLRIRFLGSVSGVGGATVGDDNAKLLSRIYIKDRGGELYNCPGVVNHVAEYAERNGDGANYQEAAINSAATDTAFEKWWDIMFEAPALEGTMRGRDSGLPLLHMLPRFGGQCEITTQLPTNFGVNSGSFVLFADVVDERRRELKARRVRRTHNIGKTDDMYPVGGSLRACYITSQLATTSYTDLIALFGTSSKITSRTLDYSEIHPEYLRRLYHRNKMQPLGSTGADPFLVTANPYAIPVVHPLRDQHIGRMQDIDQLHLRLAAAPASGVVYLDYYEDRDPELAREWLGFDSVSDLGRAVVERGMVKSAGGADSKVTSWDPGLARRLPMRVPQLGR